MDKEYLETIASLIPTTIEVYKEYQARNADKRSEKENEEL